MRSLFIFLGLFSLLIAQDVYDRKKFEKRGLVIAENSFESGCYAEAKLYCDDLENELEKYACYEEALDQCPVMAKNFREWMSKR